MKIGLSKDKTARRSINNAPRLCETDVLLYREKLTLSQQHLWKQEAMLRVQWPADNCVKCALLMPVVVLM